MSTTERQDGAEIEPRRKGDSAVVIYDLPQQSAPAEEVRILTGDRPTGPLHIGHWVGSLRNRVALQDRCKQFVLIADVQALTDNFQHPEKVRENVLELYADYLAVGIDPQKSTIYLASQIPETAELTMYFLNLVNIGRLQRNPTVKTEIQQKNFKDGIPVGFLTYPVNQAADIAQFRAHVVPVGEDQIPMIEQCNEITKRFNRIYKSEVFVETKAYLPRIGAVLPGTDGQAKMGKSTGNAIFLGDSEKAIKKKVMGMFTDPGHLRIEDPGKVEGNPVFEYLNVFDPDRVKYQELSEHYQRGGLGDGVVKQHLNAVLQEALAPIRERRERLISDKGELLRQLKASTESAREVVCQNMTRVRAAMGLNLLEGV